MKPIEYPRWPAEPPWCAKHECFAPCLECLAPEVLKKIAVEYDRISSFVVYFNDPDFNAN